MLAKKVKKLLYLKILAGSGPAALTSRALCRAGQIYLVQIALLVVAIVGIILSGRSLFHGATPAQALLAGAFLVYQPSYSDILPMYCIFLLFTPLVLLQLMKGHTRVVMATSAALGSSHNSGLAKARHDSLGYISASSIFWHGRRTSLPDSISLGGEHRAMLRCASHEHCSRSAQLAPASYLWTGTFS